MKQKLIILVVFVLMAAVLAALNAASYSQRQKEPESEFFPNRSTYNYGPTGTQAFYTLLAETGRKPVRWQEAPDALAIKRANLPKTFVIVGTTRREITEPEIAPLLRWVAAGGRLVVIDREPADGLIKTVAGLKIGVKPVGRGDIFGADPSDQNSMTHEVTAAKPSQPSMFTFGVNAVQPSKYSSNLSVEVAEKKTSGLTIRTRGQDDDEVDAFAAPVVHLGVDGKGILAATPYGSGTIVVLSDPFIISNGGISLVDNAQLAVNIVSNGGPVAFDEYHQGYGGNKNRLAEFFAGTPVIAIFFQCVLIIGLLFVSQSRRFGRALPAEGPDRLSKLEYIAAMAELQLRTRAFDLAIENIYRDFRRRAARLLGVDNTTIQREKFAGLIAERAKADRATVDHLMFKCEEIIAGEPAGKRDAVELAGDIRRLERALGLRRRSSG